MATLELPPLVRRLLPHLPEPARVWVVGGAVRDQLLGREVKDVDLAVPEGALDLGRRLAQILEAGFVPLDEERGCARLVLRQTGATIDITDFRGPTLEADLEHRDFTVNALAAPLEPPHEIVDPLGGLHDLSRRRLRAPGPGVFADDPLRGLRGVRLEAALGFRLGAETRRWIRRFAPRLSEVATERVRDELFRSLLAPNPGQAVRSLRDLRLLPLCLPQLDPGAGGPERLGRWDRAERELLATGGGLPDSLAEAVGERLEATMAGDRPRRGLVRISILLEGSGEESGRTALERLRFSRKEILWNQRFLAGLDRLGTLDDPPGDLGLHRFYRRAEDAGVEAALVGHFVDGLSGESLVRLLDVWFRRHGEIVDPDPLVTGDDLMSALAISPGPKVGKLLARLREARVSGEVTSREQALALASRSLASPGSA